MARTFLRRAISWASRPGLAFIFCSRPQTFFESWPASDAGESLKAVLRRLSRRLDSWSENRIRDVWHRDPRVKIRADEVSQLRALAEPKRKSETVHDSEELRATTRRPASPLGEVFEGRKVYTFNLSAVAIGLTDDVERSR